MKKIILFSAIALLVLATAGCDKVDVKKIKNKATVIYEGDPTVDGCGYFLLINDTKYKPTNLPLKFFINDLTVDVEYQILSSKWSCNWQIEKYSQINIINISKK